jgi:hypothetical protein
MIFNIDAIKTLSQVLPFTEEKKQKFIDSSSIIVEFRNFISEKYILTAKDAESKISEDVKKINPNITDVKDASNASFQYASDEGFTRAEDLKSAIVYLGEILSDFAANFPK